MCTAWRGTLVPILLGENVLEASQHFVQRAFGSFLSPLHVRPLHTSAHRRTQHFLQLLQLFQVSNGNSQRFDRQGIHSSCSARRSDSLPRICPLEPVLHFVRRTAQVFDVSSDLSLKAPCWLFPGGGPPRFCRYCAGLRWAFLFERLYFLKAPFLLFPEGGACRLCRYPVGLRSAFLFSACVSLKLSVGFSRKAGHFLSAQV